MSDSIRLHPVHGVAPIMLACRICHEDAGLILAGYKAESICREAFGCSYEHSYGRKLMTGALCTKCEDMLKAGAIAFVTSDGASTLMLTKDFAERNSITPGKIYTGTEAELAKFKHDIGMPPALEKGYDERRPKTAHEVVV